MPREGLNAFDPSRVDPRGRPAKGKFPKRTPEPDRDDRFTDPIIEYDHAQGKSVVGGFVYRGTRIPELIGAYIYGDYMNGNIWVARWDGEKIHNHKLLARTQLKITSFGEDEAGELYFTGFDGHIYQLRAAKRTISKDTFPETLSQTGLFESVHDLKPVAGMIPYSVNVPLWSDGADKERFVALPAAKRGVHFRGPTWKRSRPCPANSPRPWIICFPIAFFPKIAGSTTFPVESLKVWECNSRRCKHITSPY